MEDCKKECTEMMHTFSFRSNYEVCLFNQYCECIPCPSFNNAKCEIMCNRKGKISVHGAKFNYCDACRCACPENECHAKCKETPCKYVTIKNNCTDCECFFPLIDCDSPCGGEGLGILGSQNDTGCPTECDGCRIFSSKIFQSVVFISP